MTTPFATGYSGASDLKNDPESQCVSDLGPLPRGWYTIGAVLSDQRQLVSGRYGWGRGELIYPASAIHAARAAERLAL